MPLFRAAAPDHLQQPALMILLEAHARHSQLTAALALDWNSDALYDPLPVTMAYAKVLARVIKRMSGLGSAPYRFRFFI